MSDTVTEILACLRAWEPSARVIGNITAGNAIEAIERLRAELAEVQEKALRFDLDQAGIEQREREAVELVTLRAELVGCKRDAERYRWLRRARMNVDVLVREDEDSVWLDMHGWDLDAYVDAALAAKGE